MIHIVLTLHERRVGWRTDVHGIRDVKRTWIPLIALAVLTAPAVAFAADVNRDTARRLADRSGFQKTYLLQCRADQATPTELSDNRAAIPTQMFDNFYYVGLNSVGAYALKTSAGIILLDSLNNSRDAETVIVPGLRTLGLDPADIKYVVVSHGHGDHYGGARWLAETYGARVIASEADWSMMEHPRPVPRAPAALVRAVANWGSPPVRDIVATDGYLLTLGDTTIRLVLTPGHTPGTLSFIVPIRDHGRSHTLAMWGGTSIPNDPTVRATYLASLERYLAITRRARVDVELSNHPFVDDSLARMARLRASPRAPNPFVIGPGRYADYMGILKACTLAQATPRTR